MSVVSAYMVPHPPLIIPEVGNGKETGIKDTINSYKKIAKEIARTDPDTIVIATPHLVSYADYIHISPGEKAVGDFREFGVREVEIGAEYDTEFIYRLCDMSEENDLMAGNLGERDKKLDHATMIPIYFIEKELNQTMRSKIVRIGISGLSYAEHYRLGMYVKQVAQNINRKTVFIASGDLSHMLKEMGPYGYRDEGPVYDEKIMDVMSKGDFGSLFDFSEEFCSKAAECGHRTFVMLAGALDRCEVQSKKLSYEGPFGVGYGVCSFKVTGRDDNRSFLDKFSKILELELTERKANEDLYVKLARNALETYVKNGVKISIPEHISKELTKNRAGTFVSLKINGNLRGCIGTIEATKDTVAEEIIENAISAGLRDPRFPPVKREELEKITYSVDVLGETEKIASINQLGRKTLRCNSNSGK